MRTGSKPAARNASGFLRWGLAFVREWALAKVRHQVEFLEELRRRREGSDALFDAPLTTLRDCLTKLRELTGDLDAQRGTLMGLEGSAGRAYFGCLSPLLPEAFRFDGRSRHPARDGSAYPLENHAKKGA
jgi:CRISPR-associated protein Cas1